ncbi:brain-enriched guanylate kinase-associated protein [Pygocentrus nattereri]|uniref:brain-enriched guanylate kinase-associated protein n=1 Tax=Pygocentrus nattereri TaxID=42514 RepID=UPI001891806A|nr:brain-enriched guanylate kinase-associated protein [Pygocentrus nattereri]
MQNGSSKTVRGVTVNGSVSTLQRQQRPKTALNRQNRGSCSSTASCPVFSARRRDPGEDPPPRCPSSLSSPTLQSSLPKQHGSGSIPSHKNSTLSLKSSISSLQGSLPSLQGSVSNLKSFPTSSELQSSNQSLRSSTTSFCSSSTSFRSSSSSLLSGTSSEDDSWDTNSWSSGATCLLRSSIKQHSEEVFRVRANSVSRPESASDSEAGYQNLDCCQSSERQPESQQTAEKVPLGRRDSLQSQISSHCSTVSSTASAAIEEKIEAKLKFSQFLDEVTCRVLDPECLQAFGAVRQKDAHVPSPQSSLVNCSHTSSTSCQHSVHANSWFDSAGDPLPTSRNSRKCNMAAPMYQWNKCMPTCKILDSSEALRRAHEEKTFMEPSKRTYLETDIDSVRREDELDSAEATERNKGKKDHSRERERERRTLLVSPNRSQRNSDAKKCPSAVSNSSEGSPKMSYRSTSLPRPISSNLASNGETHAISSMQEQKEDLRKRLSYTTHKLEMLESEFDSTRQYLETELRRAQEELEKFTDKLHRIQSSYAALQRINQDLEDKVHRTTQQYEEEKRELSREIIVLNNHLMEAKITIEKLREDNDLYRKDCNLAAQLLQCGKSHYRTHKLSELPTDFQERVSSHIEKHGHARSMGLCHTPYSDVVPTAVIAKVLEKPEPGSSCPATRSSSPQSRDSDIQTNNGMGVVDTLHRRVVYKSSDLYCSDTALYCPTDDKRHDRWQQRRQSVDFHGKETGLLQAQNSIDTNPEEDSFHPSFSHNDVPLHEFTAGSPLASNSYSSFSTASDEKGKAPSSTLSSSHLALYMDWREGDYERKSTSSNDKDNPGFPRSHSFQHMAASPQKGNSPAYMQTASCYSEPYHSPQLTAFHSMSSSGVARETHSSIHIPEEEMSGRWRQLSVEDINAFPYQSPGRISPYSISERHFAMGPTIKLKPLYSSFQEGDDVFHAHMLNSCFSTSPDLNPSPSSKHGFGLYKPEKAPMYQSKEGSKSKNSVFLHGSSNNKVNTEGNVNKEYTDASPISSGESLHQNPLEASNMQHYKLQSPGPQRKTSPQHQKLGTTGLSRKDSLTKAQLYGTLLN